MDRNKFAMDSVNQNVNLNYAYLMIFEYYVQHYNIFLNFQKGTFLMIFLYLASE